MKLTLIRHAESEANAGYATSDPADICLTELGKRQAIELAQQFNEPPDLILVTSYKRTQQTAQPLIEKFPLTPVEVWPLHEFTFLSPASCKNTTVQDRLPMVQQYWERCDPFFVHGEGAESFEQFSKRVAESMKVLTRLNKGDVLAFTHGQVMRLLLQFEHIGLQNISGAMRYFRDIMLDWEIPNSEMKCYNVGKPELRITFSQFLD